MQEVTESHSGGFTAQYVFCTYTQLQTYLDGRMGGWMCEWVGGWVSKNKSKINPASQDSDKQNNWRESKSSVFRS